MKRIVASVGLVAIGATGIQSASAQALGAPDATKPWTIAATLRGFYDDNPATFPNHATVPAGDHRDSYGFQVMPSAALNWAMDQTTINLGVLYSLKYYENEPIGSASHTDNEFTFSAGLSHSFSERTKLHVNDSFVLGQEPDTLRANNTFATFQRVSGDNIRNYGSIGLDQQFTPLFGMGFGYDNALYDYKDRSYTVVNGLISPSLAGSLNRIENRPHIEGLWQVMPETKALVGYQFTQVGYTGDQPIAGVGANPSTWAKSDTRDYREHSFYVGAEHKFSPELTGALRAGGSYSDYYNDPYTSSGWAPYVSASMKYAYLPGSSAELGLSYDRSPTDVVGYVPMGATSQAGITVDSGAAVVYANVVHRIIPNLFANVMGQFQNNHYNGGAYDGQNDQYYLAGVDLEYRVNQYFSAHTGYNYDKLASSINDRGFDRNRVYIGVTASY